MPSYSLRTITKYLPSQSHKHINSPYPLTIHHSKFLIQPPTPLDTSPILPNTSKTYIQQVIGNLLYYARAVDHTLFVTLGTLASKQSTPTTSTLYHTKNLLLYLDTHPHATLI